MSDDLQVVTVTEQVPVPTREVQREVVTLPSERTVLVESPVNQIVEIDRDTFIVESTPEINVITVGEQGPRGIQGVAGSGQNTITKTAAVSVGGHRAVIVDSNGKVDYADSSTPAHADIVLGVTTGAAAQDADATVQTFGELVEASFNWTMGTAVYVSTNGQLTQTPPATGFKRAIGFPTAATKLFVDLGTPVIRA